jgi:hypothetical protein
MARTPSGYDLDAVLAERVFGFRRERAPWLGGRDLWVRGIRDDGGQSTYVSIHDSPFTPLWSTSTHEDVLPKFSSDLAAAWWIVERLQQMGHVVTITARSRDEQVHYAVAIDALPLVEAEQAPLAICLAALEALNAGTAER